MPRELVHAVPVPLEHVLLAEPVRAQAEDADRLVVAAAGQPPPVAAPVDAVHLGAVRHHLTRLVVLLEPGFDVLNLGTHHLYLCTYSFELLTVSLCLQFKLLLK